MPVARKALLIALGLLTAAPAGPASAGFLDFLFGRHRAAPPSIPSVVEPLFRAFANPSDRSETTRGDTGERGPSVAYCVRLCDGHPFPVQNAGAMSAGEACRSFCPAAETTVFTGGSIDGAVSSRGKRYSELPNAFVYRKKLVANCTCNGRRPGGLVSMDAQSDPTLQPGDLVAANDGIVAFRGRKSGTAAFTPVQSYGGLSAKERKALSALEIRPAPQRIAPPQAAANADDESLRAQLSR